MKLETIISTLKSELIGLIDIHKADIKISREKINELVKASSNFDHNWIGQWASSNYNIYNDFATNNGTIRINKKEIKEFIEHKSGTKIDEIQNKIPLISKAYRDYQDRILTELSVIKGNENLVPESELLIKIETHEWGISPWDYVKMRRPKTIMTTDPYFVNKGLDIPPHISMGGDLMSLFTFFVAIEDFEKLSNRILRQLEIKYSIEDSPGSKIDFIFKIINAFHNVVQQLQNRYNKRDSFKIDDEYDVQDLLHALLRMEFDDIRPEENTPSYAGSSTRVDFLLKNEKTIIEVKKTRKGLSDKEIGDQLILDSQHYKAHPDCKRLICFVYDPENRIRNPRGLEGDLNSLSTDNLIVEVFIRP